MSDTFERSCEHWSEAGRREMEDFYALASVDYRHLAEARDWKSWLEERQSQAGGRALRLLDVACGSGKFPVALRRYAAVHEAKIEPVRYDLLDPSRFSIDEARRNLDVPFAPADEHECTLQDFRGGPYEILWATHALYAIPEAETRLAMERFLDALAADGQGFIAHATSSAHYLRFYRAFLDAFQGGEGTPYTSAEVLEEALVGLGATVETQTIEYDNGAPSSQRDRIEGFLQRCAFDDRFSLEQMLEAPGLGDYLRGCEYDGEWRFRQVVRLFTVRR